MMAAPGPPPPPWARGPRGPPVAPGATRAPRALNAAIQAALALEFVFGIAVGLWPPATVPTSVTAFLGPSALSFGWLSAHVLLGALLLVLAILEVVLLLRLHRRRLVGLGCLGLASIAVAAGAGAGVLATGNGGLVIVMALFLLAAFAVYATLAHRLRRLAWAAGWKDGPPGPGPLPPGGGAA